MTDGGASVLPAYDAGLLPEPRGASDDWWQDAIRQILASAHEHYASHAADLCQAAFAPPGREDPSARSTGPGNVSSGARIVDRSAPDVGGDLASAVAAAVMGLEWTGRGPDAGQAVDEDEADRRHGSVQTAVSEVLARLGAPRAGGEGRLVSAGPRHVHRKQVSRWRDDVMCRCVGSYGPDPECGTCAGSGCVSEAEAPDTALDGAEALHRIYSQFIVNRGDLSDGEALEAIRQVCEQVGQGGTR